MENASKALIIAGAILISIILISIGIMVVRAGDTVVGGAQEQMDAQAIDMFNSQFSSYIGQQRGSTVRSLMGVIISSNASHDEQHQITVEGPNGETTPDDIRNNLKATTTYTVAITSNPKSGLAEKITITLGGATSGGSNAGSNT